jgi:alpha-1,3-mannosyltransferase
MFKWTVNLKFLPEELFLSKQLSVALLVLTVLGYSTFARKIVRENVSALNKQASFDKIDRRFTSADLLGIGKLTPNFIILVVFTSNFIGVAFARSLHYQFYSWYFHSLPYLLWSTRLPFFAKLLLWLAIEVSFNVYPATGLSSAMLQVAHGILLFSLYNNAAPIAIHLPVIDSDDEQVTKFLMKQHIS